MLKRRLSIAFIVGLALVLGLTVAPALAQDPGDPSGNGVQPVYVANNPTCKGLGYDFGFKPQVGEDDFDSGYFEGSPDGINTITADSDGTYVDWTSTLGIDAVIVKGGNNANFMCMTRLRKRSAIPTCTRRSIPAGDTQVSATSSSATTTS